MTIKNSLDGQVDVATGAIDAGCCTPDICTLSLSALSCGMATLLPNGPMWDYHKAQLLEKGKNEACGSLVDYAVFSGKMLFDLIQNCLWPALRESNPYSAVTNLDEWLDRLGWQDCYETCHRRRLSNILSPFEILGYCGPIFCPPNFHADYQLALKSAIVKALYRLRLGIIPNLASINAILEPLEVVLEAKEIGNDICIEASFDLVLKPTGGDLVVPQKTCTKQPITIPAYHDNGCEEGMAAGLPKYAWPNVMAAECIVRSLISSKKLNLETLVCLTPEGV